MDWRRFDQIARSFAFARSRRDVVKALAGGAGGIALGILGHREPAAAKKAKPLGARCHTNAQCATDYCEPTTRQCVAPCAQGTDCGYPQPCALGCSCLCDPFVSNPDGSIRRFCLQDPPDPPTCVGIPVCFSHEECPRGTFCTASSSCDADSVCLPLCLPA